MSQFTLTTPYQRAIIGLFVFLATSVKCLAQPAPEVVPFPKALVQNVWVQAIWADGKHNGFPGIARVGDCAYQSFADGISADEVLLAYYSSHEYPQPKGVGNNPANIYLAHLKVRHQAESKNEAGSAPVNHVTQLECLAAP